MGLQYCEIMKEQVFVCKWIGEGEKCCRPTIYGKSYCEQHYERIYTVMYPAMVDYIIDKELHNTDK